MAFGLDKILSTSKMYENMPLQHKIPTVLGIPVQAGRELQVFDPCTLGTNTSLAAPET